MKRLKKILITLLSVIGILLLIIVASIAWVFSNPEKAYQLAEKYVLPKDLRVTWSELDFSGHLKKGLDFEVSIDIEKIRIQKGQPHVDIPIDDLELRAFVQPLEARVKFDLIRLLASQTWEFKADPKEEKKEEPGANPFQQLQNILNLLETAHNRVPLEEVDISINRFELLSETDPAMAFGVQIEKAPQSDPIRFLFSLDQKGADPLQADLRGVLNIAVMKTDQPFLAAKADFSGFGVRANQEIKMVFQADAASLGSEGQVVYKKDKLNLRTSPDLKLYLNSKEARLLLAADVLGLPGPISKIDGLNLKMTTPLGQSGLFSEDPSHYTLRVPIELSFVKASLRRELQQSCKCELPLTIMGESQGQVWLSHVMSKNSDKMQILDSKVSIESLANRLFNVDLKATVKIDKENSQYLISPVLDSEVIIHSLQGMNPLLKAFQLIIPAPLDVLDGKIHFVAKGPVSRDEKGSHFPARLETALFSQKQRVNTNTEAQVSLSPTFRKIHIAALARIQDLQIELPPLKPIGGNPRIAADPRILKEPKKSEPTKSAFEMTFDFQVETATPGSIRLLSEFFKPYLPLTLNFRLAQGAEKENAGILQTEPFSVVYLRRKVEVEKMRLDLNSLEEEVIPVDGRLKIKQTIYTVYIDIKGLVQEPTITLWSDPYLPENEIISVLLYDRTSQDLQTGDAETSANVQAAMADKAIGLFGLWAFASTPIKSFSYNPVTKLYTATVELAGGVTAGIGTTWESAAQLELRKRVTRRWMLTARWNAATQEDDQNTELVLQWEKRY